MVATQNNARRLVGVDAAAARLGLSAGMTLADARARHPALVAIEADISVQTRWLERLADACSRYTPLVGFDGADGLMLDVSGVAHLFGGEEGLIADAEARFSRARLTLRAGLADTPRAAGALARFAQTKIAPAGLEGKVFAKTFHDMPVAALGIAPTLAGELTRAGLRRIGDLAMRPRGPIAARFGADLLARLDELHGASRPSISPRFPPPECLAERRFASPISHLEAIEATLERLADDLVVLLERQMKGARRLELALFRVDGEAHRIHVAASRPLNEARAIQRLFKERLLNGDPIDPGFGFDLMRLSCLLAEDAEPSQHEFERAFEAERAKNLADLIDRLGARLGPSRVTRQKLVDAHLPEHSFVARAAAAGRSPPGALIDENRRRRDLPPPLWRRAGVGRSRDRQPGDGQAEPPPSLALPHKGGGDRQAVDHTLFQEREAAPSRPLRLFERPEPIEALAEVPDGPPLRFRWRRVLREVAAIEGPERIAAPWWRSPDAPTRDYFRAEDSSGRRYWLYREGLYGRETSRAKWFLHGVFG